MTEKTSTFNLQTCARPNILALKPYRSARDDYKDNGTNILLDANENANGPSIQLGEMADIPENFHEITLGLQRLHRYPDPHQVELKQRFCNLRNTHFHTEKSITPENLFLGVGSDEAIDALIRCFCIPSHDNVLICPPTYGMYAVSAQINDVGVVKVPLIPAPDFSIDVQSILSIISSPDSPRIKIMFLCSPGNPTGSMISKNDIKKILEFSEWNGIVVVDEAYIDFAPENSSLAEWVAEWPNLVVIQTLSKAFGLAGIRLGVTFAPPPIASLLNSLKAPYNISSPTSILAMKGLDYSGVEIMKSNRNKIFLQRERLLNELPKIQGMGRLRGGTASNFLLFEILDSTEQASNSAALRVYQLLAETKGVIVRFRGSEYGCLGCLRITVGTEAEVTIFLRELKNILNQLRTESNI